MSQAAGRNPLDDAVLKRRVAYHEAAHAVVLVRLGFVLGESFLTRGTTADGSLGGYTGWQNPLADPRHPPGQAQYNAYARSVVTVLYAGQNAERVLADRDKSVILPASEPNWANDDREAAALLRHMPLSADPSAETSLRAESLDLVRSSWDIIDRVAGELLKELSGASPITQAPHTPAGAVLRQPDIVKYLRPLDDDTHALLNEDEAVLHHEVGHFTIWFLHGGGIGPLRLVRATDGLLGGACLFGPRAIAEKSSTPPLVDGAAERLVAGELAARRHVGLCDWHLSTGNPITRLYGPNRAVTVVRNGIAATQVDLRKVFDLADVHHHTDWWSWLEARIARVRTLLDESEASRAALVDRLRPYRPKREEWRMPGTDLIRLGYDVGLRPLAPSRTPVEIVPEGAASDACVSLRRWWRSWGRNPIDYYACL